MSQPFCKCDTCKMNSMSMFQITITQQRIFRELFLLFESRCPFGQAYDMELEKCIEKKLVDCKRFSTDVIISKYEKLHPNSTKYSGDPDYKPFSGSDNSNPTNIGLCKNSRLFTLNPRTILTFSSLELHFETVSTLSGISLIPAPYDRNPDTHEIQICSTSPCSITTEPVTRQDCNDDATAVTECPSLAISYNPPVAENTPDSYGRSMGV